MTLRKTNIDNSVKNVNKDNNSQSEHSSKDFKHKIASLFENQNKELSQSNKKILKIFIPG